MRRTVLVTLLIVGLALFTGCSKDQEKTDLQNQVTQLTEQVAQLEAQNADLKTQLDEAVLKLSNERQQASDLQKAMEVRLLHHPLTEITISPSVAIENGWMIVDGEHTFTLAGHTGASKVVFYWAESGNDFKPQQLGVDTNVKDGWTWTGSLLPGHMRALWAEAYYPGGVKIQSAVLPLRSGGK